MYVPKHIASQLKTRGIRIAFFGSSSELGDVKSVIDAEIDHNRILDEYLMNEYNRELLTPGMRLDSFHYTYLLSSGSDLREELNDLYERVWSSRHPWVVKSEIAETLHKVDSIVYVVNCERKNAHMLAKEELHALLAVCNSDVPLVVLLLDSSGFLYRRERYRLSATEMCLNLELIQAERQWMCQSILEVHARDIRKMLKWICENVKRFQCQDLNSQYLQI